MQIVMTPPASITGSGFLVVAPLLGALVGRSSLAIMSQFSADVADTVGTCGFAKTISKHVFENQVCGPTPCVWTRCAVRKIPWVSLDINELAPFHWACSRIASGGCGMKLSRRTTSTDSTHTVTGCWTMN